MQVLQDVTSRIRQNQDRSQEDQIGGTIDSNVAAALALGGFVPKIDSDGTQQDNINAPIQVMGHMATGTGHGSTQEWNDQRRPASHPNQGWNRDHEGEHGHAKIGFVAGGIFVVFFFG